MEKYSSAFKAYDIRGIYNKDIDANLCYNIGKGIGRYMLEHFGAEGKLIFGGDVRIANNELIDYFLNGLEAVGFDNYFCPGSLTTNRDGQEYKYGVISTSMLYNLNYQTFDLGVAFTASHNPAEYVGIKIFDTNSSLLDPQKLKNMITEREEIHLSQEQSDNVRHKSFHEDNQLRKLVESKYKNIKHFLLSKYQNIHKEYTIVIDFSNGAGCTHEKILLNLIQSENENLHFIYINDIPDSNFTAHESNTSAEENFVQLSKKVIKEQADFGIMFDGDLDRIGFVDNKGKYLSSDIVLLLIAESILEREEKDIIVDVMCTRALDDITQKYGVTCHRSRVGYRFVKEKMLENNGCLGGELSGHILFPETGGFENPLLALYYVVENLQEKKLSFNEVIEHLHPYYKPGISNIVVSDPDKILETIKKEYNKYTIDTTDGVKVIDKERWFIVRKSNTEPIIRISMEADTQEIRNREMKKLTQLIQ